MSAVKNGVMRMISCSKTSSGARFEEGGGGGRALPYLAYTGQVCAAEHKVLSSKLGVEFYY